MPSVDALGGLIYIWSEESLRKVNVLKSPRALFINFVSLINNFHWAMANIYGPNEDQERRDFWSLLFSIHDSWGVPWCFGGDYITP